MPDGFYIVRADGFCFAAVMGSAGINNPYNLLPEDKVLLLWTYARNGIGYSAPATLAQRKELVFQSEILEHISDVQPSVAIDEIFANTTSGFDGNLLSVPTSSAVSEFIAAAQNTPQNIEIAGWGTVKCVTGYNTELTGWSKGFFGLTLLTATV